MYTYEGGLAIGPSITTFKESSNEKRKTKPKSERIQDFLWKQLLIYNEKCKYFLIEISLGNISYLKMSVETLRPYFETILSGQSFEPGKDMKYEFLRLKSFSEWPRNCPISAIRLAQAGFYFTGKGDEVVCFCCHSKRANWKTGDFPLAVHRQLKPDCPFINGEDRENVCIGSINGSRFSNPFTNITITSSLSFDSNRDQQSQLEQQNDNTRSNITDLEAMATRTDATSGLVISRSRLDEIGSLRFESHRLETFRNWPSSVPVTPADVAHTGMFYTGLGDRCQCVYCKGMLRNWEPGDVPHIEHVHHFPRCPFILGMNVGNIPIAPSQSEASAYPFGANSVSGMEALGVNTEQPRHPQYAVEAVRISSYQNWPTHKHQTPKLLAKCGFFYAGFGDNVKCFFCDGGLRNWETGDDPWVEHARWFPRCAFVRQCKGEDFIKEIQDLVTQRKQELSINAGKTDYTYQNEDNEEHHIEEREVCARMDTPAVLAVLEMGFSRDLVKKAISKRLVATGDDFPNAESLVEAIFTIDPAEEFHRDRGASKDTSPSGAQSNGEGSASNSTASNEADNQISVQDESPTLQNADEAVCLLEENRQLKEQRMCKVCMDDEVSVVFLPCGHLVCCPGCAPAMRKCPICRKNIKGSVRTYLS